MTTKTATSRFRITIVLFIAGLILSGLTAFPLLLELRLVAQVMGLGSDLSPEAQTGLAFWILSVHQGLEHIYADYPWVGYGTDWLAFSHIVIASFFLGAFINPKNSLHTLYSGIFACLSVIPLAFICGSIRQIPIYWRLIDCSFGAIGILPLLYCLKLLKVIATREGNEA